MNVPECHINLNLHRVLFILHLNHLSVYLSACLCLVDRSFQVGGCQVSFLDLFRDVASNLGTQVVLVSADTLFKVVHGKRFLDESLPKLVVKGRRAFAFLLIYTSCLLLGCGTEQIHAVAKTNMVVTILIQISMGLCLRLHKLFLCLLAIASTRIPTRLHEPLLLSHFYILQVILLLLIPESRVYS